MLTDAALEKFLIIDGHSLLYRAFYALPPLTSRRGEHTGAVFGFTNMLFKLLEDEKPAYIAVAFDPPTPSFRATIDPDYKAQREAMPQELAEQFSRTRQVLEAMNIAVFMVDNYEADDVIGTLAGSFQAEEHQVVVVTGDADLLQLISGSVKVLLTKRGISQTEAFDQALLQETYGLTPQQFTYYKALKGDPSDNIPGVPGIGDKTALALLHQYGDIENIYQNIDELKGRVKKNLLDYREQLERGLDLVTLRCDLDLDLNFEELRLSAPNFDKLLALFGELEFNNLARRVESAAGGTSEAKTVKPQATELKSLKELKEKLDLLNPGQALSLRFAQGQVRPHFKQPLKVVGIAAEGQGAYYYLAAGRAKEGAQILKWLQELAGRGTKLFIHDYKEFCHLFFNEKINPPAVAFDTLLAAYLIDSASGRYSLSALLQRYLGLETEEGAA